MTISSSTNRYTYVGNGVTTAFAYSSRFLANGDLVVLLVVDSTGVSTTKTLTTHYTITGADAAAGGTVTMITAPATGETLVIYGDPAVTQLTDWTENDPDPAEVKETAFDRLTLICARLKDRVSRAFMLPDSDTTTSLTMPTPAANNGLGWNSTGTAIINYVFQTGTTLISLIASGGSALIGFIQAGAGAVARTVQDKARDVVSVKDYGAIGDGVTNDYAAINLAHSYLTGLANGGTLHIPTGLYKLGTSLTLNSDVQVVFAQGAQLQPDTGTTLTINGSREAPPTQQIFGGLGAVLIPRGGSQPLYADWFVGADYGIKLNNALAALTGGGDTGPGVIKITAANHVVSTKINFDAAEGIRLTSDFGYMGRNYGAAQLRWTGGASSGPMMSLAGAAHVEIDHIYFIYDSTAYDGNLINLASSSPDGIYIHIHHCGFSGSSASADTAERLIQLAFNYGVTIEHCYFNFAGIAIGASDTACLNITIRNNLFESGLTSAIKARNGNWVIENNIHQNDAAAGVKTFVSLGGETLVLNIKGNVLGVDSGAAAGTVIDLSGAVSNGVVIEGNSFAGGGGTSVLCHSTAGSTSGLSFTGNYVDGTTGLTLGRADGVTITGNSFSVTTPWNGTEPTRVFHAGNDTGITTTTGIPVAVDAVIALSKPGNSASGFGMLNLIVTYSDGTAVQAVYLLNGGSASVTEVSDPATAFSGTINTADSVNIYWETDHYKLQNKVRSTTTPVAITVIPNSITR